MYCNHRSYKNPGACKYCWRFGIIIWSVLVLGLLLMYTFVPPSPPEGVSLFFSYTIMPIIILGVSLLILHSIKTKWKKGD
jgi:hypothetical protein